MSSPPEIVDDPGALDGAEDPDPSTLAPPVVVALVAHDPGPWFEDALASLGAQDYPNLSVLVIDAGTTGDLIGRVAPVLPSAFVRRVEGNPGFGAAANDVLGVVEGAAFFCFCHDDVALDPGAIRSLVEEALRSNAGIVGPKLVDWDEPERLLEVGLAADKAGVVTSLVDPGELDQEQHDAIRDVFAVPSACVLVRADLFTVLEGFDPGIELHGEDLDLCWRAQVAGARVVVVPEAKARHRSRLLERSDERDIDHVRRSRARHRVRTVLTCYSRFHLLRVIPQALVLLVAEVVLAVAGGRFRQAGDLVGAWSWNLGQLGDIRERRAKLRAIRRFPDSEVRRLQMRGSARFTSFLRGELGQAEQLRDSLFGVGRGITESFTSGPRRLVLAAWLLVAFAVVVGSRDLVAGRVPFAGSFSPIDASPFTLLRAYLSGWHTAGTGSEAPVPTLVGLLGLAGLPTFGQRGLLQILLVVGMIPAGAAGAWRLTRPFGSRRARAATLALYVANPLPYDAIARGSWGGVIAYGASPWLLHRLLRAVGDEPYERIERVRAITGCALLLALVGALVPVVLPLFVLVALAIVVGSLAAGAVGRALEALVLALVAGLLAAAMHLPWALDFVLPGSRWWNVGGVAPVGVDEVRFVDLLRFHVGDFGVPILGWALPVAALLPLLLGRGWRFRWAVRAWAITLTCWAVAWAGANGFLGVEVPSPHVVLAPAAASLAFAAGLGLVAFEQDLKSHRFGFRQVVSIASFVAVLLAIVPVLVAATDGRWGAPALDLGRALAFLDDEDHRTLWIGDPALLPLAGHELDDDVAYAIADGVPGIVDRVATSPSSGDELVGDALQLVAEGRTDRLGRMLAPFGIRYVVLVSSSAPSRASGIDEPLPEGLDDAIGRQLDLRRLPVDPAVAVFENTEPASTRMVVDAADLDDARAFTADLASAEPVLRDGDGHLRWRGRVDRGSTVHHAVPASDRWELSVGGDAAERSTSLGWANRYDVGDSSGEAVLRYRTAPSRYLAVLGQLVLWAVVIRLAVRRRRAVTTTTEVAA